VFLGEFLRRIAWKFFLGIRFWSGGSLVTVRPTTEDRVPIPPDVGLQTTLRALGLRLNRDTSPNRFYPLKGRCSSSLRISSPKIWAASTASSRID
jgi:hypothetical protein